MEKQTEKIKQFSKIVSAFLNIAFISLIVAAALELLAWLWTASHWPTETTVIGGVTVEAPLLFQLGSTKVLLPVAWEPGFRFWTAGGSAPAIGFGEFLATVFTLVGLRFAKAVFKLLRENGSPFREDVVKALKRLAIALLCVGCVSGAIPFLSAGIVWVLCLIFDYGRKLQDESDTTL